MTMININMSKNLAEQAYREYLSDIKSALGNRETDSDQLKKAGKSLFGSSFRGVFASDKIPKLSQNAMAIVNLDKSGQPGSHWVGLYKSGDVLLYDSFGRKTTTILPSVMQGNGRVLDTEHDVEQADSQEDCGQRVLAFLCVCRVHGAQVAKYI